MKRYVVGFAFDERETQVALILKARPDWQKGRLNGIGGHIEEDESPLEAMEREWMEETSDHDSPPWASFALLEGDGFEVYFFRGNTETHDLECSSEGESIVQIPVNEIPTNAVSNLHWLIPMARAASQHDWPYKITERSKDIPQ